MPYFSIIIPVYNVAQYLRECLDSVLAQTFTDWEAIGVDDGSTDGSGVILDEYAVKDKRFRVIHQENKGVNFARQRALDASNGKWIASIDGDDLVLPSFLQVFYDVVSSGNYDFIWSDYYLFSKGDVLYRKQSSIPDVECLQVNLLRGVIWGGNWNKVYSRDFILKYNISFPIAERVCVCEDLCFNVSFLSYNPVVKYVPCACYYYRDRKGSALRSTFTLNQLYSGIYVNRFLMEKVFSEEAKRIIELRKVELKAQSYSSPSIPNMVFKKLYPEILSIKDLSLPLWHKVLFGLSCRGVRTPILFFLNLVRIILKRNI